MAQRIALLLKPSLSPLRLFPLSDVITILFLHKFAESSTPVIILFTLYTQQCFSLAHRLTCGITITGINRYVD